MRTFLSSFILIHTEVLLGFLALFGYLMTENKALLFLVVLSFAGALCGAFIRTIDSVGKKN